MCRTNAFSLEIMDCTDDQRMEERKKKPVLSFINFISDYFPKNFKADIRIPYSPNGEIKVQIVKQPKYYMGSSCQS